MKQKARFLTNCINSTDNFINRIQDASIDITPKTFFKYVSREEVKEMFPVYDRYMKIEDDYAVSFHRSVYLGRFHYFICHSSIEYIWRL